MATLTNVDPAKVQSSANNTAECRAQLESNLGRMLSEQNDLSRAVQGQTGTAIQKTMGEAYSLGKQLSGTMQEIIDALNTAVVRIDASDMSAAGQVAKMGAGGSFSSGDGQYTGSVTSKVDTFSW